jgi:hypothetical protein
MSCKCYKHNIHNFYLYFNNNLIKIGQSFNAFELFKTVLALKFFNWTLNGKIKCPYNFGMVYRMVAISLGISLPTMNGDCLPGNCLLKMLSSDALSLVLGITGEPLSIDKPWADFR